MHVFAKCSYNDTVLVDVLALCNLYCRCQKESYQCPTGCRWPGPITAVFHNIKLADIFVFAKFCFVSGTNNTRFVCFPMGVYMDHKTDKERAQ